VGAAVGAAVGANVGAKLPVSTEPLMTCSARVTPAVLQHACLYFARRRRLKPAAPTVAARMGASSCGTRTIAISTSPSCPPSSLLPPS
jgi:hypothetical protein